MTNKPRNILIAVVVIIVLIVVGILSNKKPTTGQITVGGLFNLTGYAAFAGESSRDGFTMAIEDFGLDEAKVRTVIEDAQSDLKQAVSGATKLVDIDNAIVVIGPEWTEFGEVVSPVAVKYKVPFIATWIAAEAPYVKQPYYWSATPSDRSEHIALTAYLARHNLKKVSLVYSNNFWSQMNIQMFKEMAAKNNLTIISEHELDQTTRDFRTTVAKIKTESPDVIYSAIAEDEGHGAFVSQVRQLGITVPIGAHSGRASSAVMKERYPTVMHDQIFGDQIPEKRRAEFEAKYEKRFGKKVQAPSAAAAYDMTTLVLNAIKSGADTSEEIIAYMRSVPAFEGYSGPIDFDEKGLLPLRDAVVKKYSRQGVAEVVE